VTVTDITPYQPVPFDAPESVPARPRLLLVGTSLASAGVAVGYAALSGYYASVRQAVRATGVTWLPDGVVLPLTQPNFMLLTLSFSVVSMMWALWAVRHDDRANALIAFTLTLLFGVAQVFQTAYLLFLMEMPAAGNETGAAPLIYTMIGVQLALSAVGMAYVVAAALRTLGGGYSARDYEGVLSATVFWITTVGVYITLWYVVYITK
jgi:heme/copper-type cytochrome/quinol oxidase subunit 3